MLDGVLGVGAGRVGAGDRHVVGGHRLGQLGPAGPLVAGLSHVVGDEGQGGAVADARLGGAVGVGGEVLAGHLVGHRVGVSVVLDLDHGGAVGGDLHLLEGLGGEAGEGLGGCGGVGAGGAGHLLAQGLVLGVAVALDVLEEVLDGVLGVRTCLPFG